MWANFADPLDLVTLDTTLADDFGGSPQLIDATVDNPSPTTMPPAGTSACGKFGQPWPLHSLRRLPRRGREAAVPGGTR